MLKHSGSATRQGADSPDERVFFTQLQKIIPDWQMQSAIGQYVTKNFAFINYVVLGSFKKSISLFRMQR